jgi:F-box protein 11
MTVIKVQSSLFSSVKTVGRALDKMELGDEILVMNGHYKETLTFHQDAQIIGNDHKQVIIQGTLLIPKDVHIILRNLTIQVTDQIYVEGSLLLQNVDILGMKTNSLLSINNGELTMQNCFVSNSNDIGIAALKASHVTIKECEFIQNGKSHLYAEESTLKIVDSHFSKANHALWIKKNSSLTSISNSFQEHSGTQIIVQNKSTFHDMNSKITNGAGNGLLANENSTVDLNYTTIQHHKLPQIWVQTSSITCKNCEIQHGEESALMLRSNAEAIIEHCYIAHHKIANIQVTAESRLQLATSQLASSEGIGIHIREASIVNFDQCSVKNSKLSQIFSTDRSILTLKDCEISNGQQLGIYIENDSNCTILNSKIQHHPNTAITITDAELMIMESDITDNAGNGILALQNGILTVDRCQFTKNAMPHIAGKEQSALKLTDTTFHFGKSIYMLDQSNVEIYMCTFEGSDGVQIEINEQTKLAIEKSIVKNGKGNAFKASKNSTITITECQISTHVLPQIVVNDSSLIFKNSELLEGERNGFIIENHSEAYIQDSYISKHRYPQIWIDRHSTVEMKATQITEGNESDIYVQNHSSLYADQCIIRNERFQFNVQAVNHSKIDLTHSIVENKMGDEFYIENNSFITHKVDDL